MGPAGRLAWLPVLALLVLAVSPGDAAFVNGWVDTNSQWAFLGKFAYMVGSGSLNITGWAWSSNTTMLALYNDAQFGDTDWDDIVGLSCLERLNYSFYQVSASRMAFNSSYVWVSALLSFTPKPLRRITVTGHPAWICTWRVPIPVDTLINLKRRGSPGSDVAATDCGRDHLDLMYEFTCLNPGNPVWSAPFSAQEQGTQHSLPEFSFSALLCRPACHVLLVHSDLHPRHHIRDRRPPSPLAFPLPASGIITSNDCTLISHGDGRLQIVAILALVIFVEFLSAFLFLEHWAVYSGDGVGHPLVKMFAERATLQRLADPLAHPQQCSISQPSLCSFCSSS